MKSIPGLIGLALLLGAPGLARAEAPCAQLGEARLPHAEVTEARTEVLPGGVACRLSVTSRPTPDSDIRIEVWIPEGPAWNGKYVQVGNGGLGGAIPLPAIRANAERGYASAGTDDGHRPASMSAAWALGHPEKVTDFASRALKETTEAAKILIALQKGTPAGRSYFVGCSAGGREALMEAQRFPADFDGIVAGAPANYNSLLTGGRAYMQQMLARPGAYLGLAQLQLLQDAALRNCADGGAYILDPQACHFDPGALRCGPGQTAGCLTAPQVAAARALYGGRPDRAGRPIFPGYMPGAEAAPGGFQAWNTGTSQDRIHLAAGYGFASSYLKYFLYSDPAFDILKADLGPKFDHDRRRTAPITDAVDPNLTTFKARGGKLIQYHGWNDPGIPPLGSVRYFGEVTRAMGEVGDFYRLYMIPGMLHCGGGPGPSTVDWLGLIDRWVEGEAAPGELMASGPAGGQRLCPYPGVARKAGDTWACVVPPRK